MKLTARQQEAWRLLGSEARYILLYGGSRSGKTFLSIRAMCMRAIKAPKSRHAILRFRNNAVKQAVVMDTFPKVMELCFPQAEYTLNMSDLYAKFANGSEVWFGGLDDKERVEKILGNEYVTLMFNEISQIPYQSYLTALTRLAQKVDQVTAEGIRPLPVKVYLDENPPLKSHWSYKLFVQKVTPDDKRDPIKHPALYAHMQINPGDNQENLPPEYLEQLAAMPERMKRRFLLGEFSDANENLLFPEVDIDKWRKTDGNLPDMVRIVVAVDPSGADDDPDATNDAIGICVAGLGTDGVGYLMEDITVKAGPAVWGKVACDAYERHQADVIIGEQNYGGEMVRFVVKTANPRVNFRKITSSRGKVIRAEPIAALMIQGKVRLAGYFPELEDELAGFKKNAYIGDRSPNRADAFVFCMAELFPGVVTPRREPQRAAPVTQRFSNSSTAWMA